MCGAQIGGPDLATLKPGETAIQGQVTKDGEPVSGYVRLLDSTGEFTAEVPMCIRDRASSASTPPPAPGRCGRSSRVLRRTVPSWSPRPAA